MNTSALHLLRLWDGSEVPHGVSVEYDEYGAPTGRIDGINIFNPTRLDAEIAKAAPTPSSEQVILALRAVMDESLAAGVTAVYEPHLNTRVAEFTELAEMGQLPLRVGGTYELPVRAGYDQLALFVEEHSDALGAGSGDERLAVRGFTASLDGAIQFGKAHMRADYGDPWGRTCNGASAVNVDELVRLGRFMARSDSRFHLLAAGSAAIDTVVAALEQLHEEIDLRGREWMVLHMQHPSRMQVHSLAAMGIRAQSYTSVDFSKGAGVYRDRLAPGTWRSVVPIRWWLDSGVRIAQGSDGSHHEPLFHVWDALVRRDGRTGASLMADPKRVTREESIRMCTRHGAHVMQLEDKVGSIEVGKLADFVVLDGDPLSCPVDAIVDLDVMCTVVEGTVVHGWLS